MPLDFESNRKVYWVALNENGNEIGEMQELKGIQNISYTIDYTKNISRKRLKKLIMSKGIGRNLAEKVVWQIWQDRKSYSMLDYFLWEIFNTLEDMNKGWI